MLTYYIKLILNIKILSIISSYCLQLFIHMDANMAAFLLFHAQINTGPKGYFVTSYLIEGMFQIKGKKFLRLALTSSSHTTSNNEWFDHVRLYKLLY